MFVQNLPITEPSFVNVKVRIDMDGTILTAHNEDPIMVHPEKKRRVHIVTDRTTHMPGDKIRFRILVLDEHLLPQNAKVRRNIHVDVFVSLSPLFYAYLK